MKVTLYQNNYYSRWQGEFPLEKVSSTTLEGQIKQKIAEHDEIDFFVSDGTIYGKVFFNVFPTENDLFVTYENLQKKLKERTEEILRIKKANEILNEVSK